MSPIRRCIGTDHGVTETDNVSYRVTAMKSDPGGSVVVDRAFASNWTQPSLVSGQVGDGLSAYFNRGTLMSQVVSRFVDGDVGETSLRKFTENLSKPGFPARRYLSGDARHQILTFLGEADRKGNDVYAAIYEINDRELVDAFKPFGSRGHILIGNGGGTEDWVSEELAASNLEVHHRDLSHAHRSSPSVHNKFIVEVDANTGNAVKVLTGSTNFTFTGLCTQLNNVLILERPETADRFLKQWDALVKAKDDLTDELIAGNNSPTSDGRVTTFFAATAGEVEFAPVLDTITNAQQGVLFLMFTPGRSPHLKTILNRAQENQIHVRGVVSSVRASDQPDSIIKVEGEVVRSGAPIGAFHRDILVPTGISERKRPSWAETEFGVCVMLKQQILAIVHSKVILVDPFSDDCVVVTGSHNFSDSASQKNDENLVIVRGNRLLAQAYAIHIAGVYDHYSWRVFLANGGDPNVIYKPLDGWKPGGARAKEPDFWMSGN